MEVRRPVFLCGENPALTLFESGKDRVVVAASYWHCTDSPVGTGQALVLWIAGSGEETSAVYTDNPLLARRLVDDLTRHFPEFEGIPVADLPVVGAVSGHTFDGTAYRVECQTEAHRIELAWSGPLDRKQIVWPGFPAGQATFDLTTVICPCASAGLRVDGRPIDGEVRLGESRDGHPTSSAFLAFAETWIGPLSPSS